MSEGDHGEDEPAQRYLGRVVMGSYQAMSVLGQGGMGLVFKAQHLQLVDTYGALKVLYGADLTNAARKRFEREAQVAARLGSERVAKPLGMGTFEEDGHPWNLYEFVAGQSLEQRLKDVGPFASVIEALTLIAQVTDTMTLAHREGIVHRDLKPGNVMLAVDRWGRSLGPKILDWGVARATGEEWGALPLTAERSVVGTPVYMPPEAWSSAAVDGRADSYAIAVILFEMLAGRLPFVVETINGAMQATMFEVPPKIAELRPAGLPPVPADVEAVVARAMTKKPEERPTMQELHDGVAFALGRLTGGVAPLSRSLAMAGPMPAHEQATFSVKSDEIAKLLDSVKPSPVTPAGARSVSAEAARGAAVDEVSGSLVPPMRAVRWSAAVVAVLFAVPVLAAGGAMLVKRMIRKPTPEAILVPREQPRPEAGVSVPSAPIPALAPTRTQATPPPPPVRDDSSLPVPKERPASRHGKSKLPRPGGSTGGLLGYD